MNDEQDYQIQQVEDRIEKLETINAELLAATKELRESNSNLKAIAIRCDEENNSLLALNAELLAALKSFISLGETPYDTLNAFLVREQGYAAIAKAEKVP